MLRVAEINVNRQPATLMLPPEQDTVAAAIACVTVHTVYLCLGLRHFSAEQTWDSYERSLA